MKETTLEAVIAAVVRRARQQGSITSRDIRAEAKLAGLPESRWRDLAARIKSELQFRQGRYYPPDPVSVRRAEAEAQHDRVAKAIRGLIRAHRAATKLNERRGENRIDFVQPVRVHLADGATCHLLSRDLSTTGIRLVGTKQLLGQRVQVELPQGKNMAPLLLAARILWTCSVGDDLFENGGSFLELTSSGESPYPKLAEQ